MSIFKKKDQTAPAVDTAPAADSSSDMETNLDEVMRKYDRESATRIWEGVPKIIITVIMTIFSLYCLYMTLFSTALPEVRLTLFVGCIIILGFLTYPAKKGHVKVNSLPWYDIVLMVVGAGCFFYFAFNALPLIQLATRIEPIHVVIGVVGILVLVELCRRCVGIPILCVVGALLIYTFYNQLSYNPSFYNALKNVVYKLFYTTSGVIGTPINVCFTYIVLFIVFGAFLERTGIADFFINISNAAVGWMSGGPAKVAVVVSAMEGMVSGSSVANTVGSGSVTIPLMKKTGYKPEFAAAAEASASTGGQIMPPIMGAAAFLMADYVQLPYSQIVLKAILPAVLYFAGIFIAVHLEARKSGLRGLRRDELPKLRPLLKQVYLLLPLALLIYLVSSSTRSIQYAAAIAIVAAIFVSIFNKDHRPTPMRLLESLAAGGQGTITVAAACGIAGIIAGTITMTGLANMMINGIVALAGNQVFIALFLTMLCCIVLGMGVPTTANYCIMAATCAPILIRMGVPAIAAHFFVFYFGIVADLTPPVALAAYAGAAIAQANPMKTALTSTKLAIAAFIVPYVFALNPAMLLIDTTAAEVILICVTSLVGIFGVSAALEGYLKTHMAWYERVVCCVGGLMLIFPGVTTDIVGVALVGFVCVAQFAAAKKALPVME